MQNFPAGYLSVLALSRKLEQEGDASKDLMRLLASTEFKYSKGWKYQVEELFVWELRGDFTILEDYDGQYYGVTKSGFIYFKISCCYNGADLFPDFDWIKPGACVHDGILWLIALGIIPESENDLADAELGEVVKHTLARTNRFYKMLIRFRAMVVATGTRFARTSKGEARRRVLTIALKSV